jgi:hypothetical protein
VKLWQIPKTSLQYYERDDEDRNWIMATKKLFVPSRCIVEPGEGIRFPGLWGDNKPFEDFYEQTLSSVFCSPRGNTTEHGFVVLGIAPGWAKFSEKYHEPMWLLGPSSRVLHNILGHDKIRIYPYFTDVFKEPFKDEDGKYINKIPQRYRLHPEYDSLFGASIAILKEEISVLSPRLVILLGKGIDYKGVYDQVRTILDEKNQSNPSLFKHVTINHPNSHGLTLEERVREVENALKGIVTGTPISGPLTHPDIGTKDRWVACRHQYWDSCVDIHWHSTLTILESKLGHGVHLDYGEESRRPQFVVAFVNEFDWLHGVSDDVTVDILDSKSAEFASRNLNGAAIVAEAKAVLRPYLLTRTLPKPDEDIGNNFRAVING